MKEKRKIIKKTVDMMSWVLSNKYLKKYIMTLLNDFILTYVDISVTIPHGQISRVKLAKENGDSLIISFDNSNVIELTHKTENITEYKKIERIGMEINVFESHSSIVENGGMILEEKEIETTKVYKNGKLVKSTLSEYFDATGSNPDKSYWIEEETIILPNDSAIIKYNAEAGIESNVIDGLIYFEANPFLNINFEDSKEKEKIQIIDIICEERYNELLSLHQLMLLPTRFVTLKYVSNEGNIETVFGLLMQVDKKTVNLLLDDDIVEFEFEEVKSITYCGEDIYVKNETKDKTLNFEK